MQKIIIFLSFFFIINFTNAQTIGTLQHEEGSLEGYTFFSPFSGTKAWIVDNCGQLINSWDRGTNPGLAAYFLDNGLLFRTYKTDLEGPFTSASNMGGIELVDWNNNIVWAYEINTATQLSHHDAVYMPNGNVLILTWELVYTNELIELGRDPDEISSEGYMWSEHILELEPVGTNDANIVWEWEIKDHYIQDFDATKAGYGVIAEHPELFNINLPELNSSNSNSTRDWNHFNSIDYNEDLDQILLSVRNSDEIWILDHSTTTEEAASHEGGDYGKGGDILYRWGNASAYERAPVSDQKLFGQHGVHWIRDGLEDAGKIMIFNNGNGRPGPDYSTVEILTPPQDANGGYIFPTASEPFGPSESDIIYGDQSGEDYYSAYLSNAQRLTNGNTLVNAGSPGNIFEIDANRNIVWEYEIPLFGDTPGTQGGGINNNANFRAYKHPANYAGFEGIDLTPGTTIENGVNPLGCSLTTSVEDLVFTNLEIYYDAIGERLVIDNQLDRSIELNVFDLYGRSMMNFWVPENQKNIDVSNLVEGIYFVSYLNEGGTFESFKFVR